MRLLLLSTLWIHLAGSVLLTGAFFMLVLAGVPDAPTARRWDAALVTWARRLVLVVLGSGVVWLLLRTAAFENRLQAAFEPGAVWHAIVDTQPGLVWLARHGVLVVLGAFLAMRADVAERRNWLAARGEALALAALALALMSGANHAAAVTPGTGLAVAVDVTHLLATGVWGGALGPLALLVCAASREAGAAARPYAVRAARRFSATALIVMLLLTASGAMNALVQIESIPALAGTTHGQLLLAKLAILVPILAVAVVNRVKVIPQLSGASGHRVMRRLAAFVGVEAALVFVLLGAAAAMALTTPGRHDPPVWPLPFRLSLDVLTDVPGSRWRAVWGSQMMVVGLVVALASCFARRRRGPMRIGALALIAGGVVAGLLPLVVDAYPTTYRRPLVTYHAESVATGMGTYREHCAACHGVRGEGSGASAPPVLFPVVTDGARTVETYRMFASGPHAEFLIDRQGYIRAIWREKSGGLQAQVEKLNEESDVAPFPDDHVH
jgi:putative copper export protein